MIKRTKRKSIPELTEAVCAAFKPPPRTKAIATAPSVKAQSILCPTGAFNFPPEVILSITKDPLSDEVTKKIETINIPMTLLIPLSGNSFKKTKSEVELSFKTGIEMRPAFCNSSNKADPPKAEIQKKVITVGTNSTPKTNSFNVLPLETLAINIPTNGDQAIHHDQ